MTTIRVTAMVMALFAWALPAGAQLDNESAPIVVGHYHLNVTSIAEHERFWVTTLGGVRTSVGSRAAIHFPGVLLVLREQMPSGPTRGTTFDHMGFAVPDVPAMTARAVANGYPLTVGREPPPGESATLPTAGDYGRFSYLLGPDGVKVELVTADGDDAPPIAHHHVHFVNRAFVEMQQWYMRAFEASLRPGQTDFFIGADLPGVGYSLNFFSWLPEQALTGTAGRVVDHVGFEVRDLAAFCAALETRGIALQTPYHRDAQLGGLAVAYIEDPWGTLIALTEGLRELR